MDDFAFGDLTGSGPWEEPEPGRCPHCDAALVYQAGHSLAAWLHWLCPECGVCPDCEDGAV
jgi:hypothetical protein